MLYCSSKRMLGDYFEWLCDLVGSHRNGRSYFLILKELHSHSFYAKVAYDENRAADGIELREEYSKEIDYPPYIDIYGECTVLEMIISVSRIMEFETSGAYSDDRETLLASDWFWEIIENLGLLLYSDDCFCDYEVPNIVEQIIDNLVERHYSRNGKGGMFPLRHTKKDQRKVEIWYQLSAYLGERDD